MRTATLVTFTTYRDQGAVHKPSQGWEALNFVLAGNTFNSRVHHGQSYRGVQIFQD